MKKRTVTLLLCIVLLCLPHSALQESSYSFSVKGIPEMNDLKIEWNMSVDEVYSLINASYKDINEWNDEEGTVTIFAIDYYKIKEGIESNLQIYFFYEDKLESILLMFPEEKMTDIIYYYAQNYGFPTNYDQMMICNERAWWYGGETSFTLYSGSSFFSEDEGAYYVAYYHNIMNPYDSNSLKTIDPFQLYYYINKDIDSFIADYSLTEFTKTEYISGFKEANFIMYKFNMYDEYLGLSRNKYHLQLTTKTDSSSIVSASYCFQWNSKDIETLVSLTKKINYNIYNLFNQQSECSYTSNYYSDLGIKTITISTLYDMISQNIQGIYRISYKNDFYTFNFSVSITPDKQDIDCELSIS